MGNEFECQTASVVLPSLFILFTNLWKYGTGVPRDREAETLLYLPSNRKNVRKNAT